MALTLQLIQFLFLLGMPVGLGQSSPTLRGSNLTQAKAGNLTKSGWGSATISKGVLHDKIMGYWVGQLVGNFMGLPFEFQYNDQPMPLEPQTYYDLGSGRAAGLRVNADGRGRIPQRLNRLQGAYTDDDTDIEFVTLHALENHGLDLNYKQIAGYWKNYVHITVNGGDALWFANRVARENMNRGQLPPQTGSQSQNRYWWTIDPQLVNELWSAVYPGMIDKAVERAEWGARITSDSWGTHPTRFYAALYSGAFFQSSHVLASSRCTMGQSCCCGRVKEDWPDLECRSPAPIFRGVKAQATLEPEGVAEVEASLVEEDLPKSPRMAQRLTSQNAGEPQEEPGNTPLTEQAHVVSFVRSASNKEDATLAGVGLGQLALLNNGGHGKVRRCQESHRQVSTSTTSSSQQMAPPLHHDGGSDID